MTQLRRIQLHGPAVPRPVGLGPGDKWDHPPFWVLQAGAPDFRLSNVKPQTEALQEDRMHPLRTLLLDTGDTAAGKQKWRYPRLISMHIIAGELAGSYGNRDDESLAVWLPGGSPDPVKSFKLQKKQRVQVFRTYDKAEPVLDRAAFQNIVVQPVMEDAKGWPNADPDDIDVPPFC